MRTIRSFIAVPLSPEVQSGARRLVSKIAGEGDGIRWVPMDNLHLTLKFLGDVDNTEVPAVCKIVRNVTKDFEPFDLDFAGASALPNLDRPRVISVSVSDPSESLRKIVARLETELAEMGFKPEPRDYVPHLTLGRTKGGSRRASEEVVQRVKQYLDIRLGAMCVDTVELIASFLEKKGPSYQVMDTIDLG